MPCNISDNSIFFFSRLVKNAKKIKTLKNTKQKRKRLRSLSGSQIDLWRSTLSIVSPVIDSVLIVKTIEVNYQPD